MYPKLTSVLMKQQVPKINLWLEKAQCLIAENICKTKIMKSVV